MIDVDVRSLALTFLALSGSACTHAPAEKIAEAPSRSRSGFNAHHERCMEARDSSGMPAKDPQTAVFRIRCLLEGLETAAIYADGVETCAEYLANPRKVDERIETCGSIAIETSEPKAKRFGVVIPDDQRRM